MQISYETVKGIEDRLSAVEQILAQLIEELKQKGQIQNKK